MNASPVVDVSRVIGAPRDRVFDAWLDPLKRKAWFVPAPGYACVECEIDDCVGGHYRILLRRTDAPTVVEISGAFTEIDRPSRLAFTWTMRTGEPASLETFVAQTLVRVELSEVDGGTKVAVRHHQLDHEAAREGHERGWTGCLEILASQMDNKT